MYFTGSKQSIELVTNAVSKHAYGWWFFALADASFRLSVENEQLNVVNRLHKRTLTGINNTMKRPKKMLIKNNAQMDGRMNKKHGMKTKKNIEWMSEWRWRFKIECFCHSTWFKTIQIFIGHLQNSIVLESWYVLNNHWWYSLFSLNYL